MYLFILRRPVTGRWKAASFSKTAGNSCQSEILFNEERSYFFTLYTYTNLYWPWTDAVFVCDRAYGKFPWLHFFKMLGSVAPLLILEPKEQNPQNQRFVTLMSRIVIRLFVKSLY